MVCPYPRDCSQRVWLPRSATGPGVSPAKGGGDSSRTFPGRPVGHQQPFSRRTVSTPISARGFPIRELFSPGVPRCAPPDIATLRVAPTRLWRLDLEPPPGPPRRIQAQPGSGFLRVSHRSSAANRNPEGFGSPNTPRIHPGKFTVPPARVSDCHRTLEIAPGWVESRAFSL
jgi:hypothetical protein